MASLLMLLFFIPGTSLCLYEVLTSIQHGNHSQAIGFGFPFVIFLIATCGYFEQDATRRSAKEKEKNREIYLENLSYKLMDRILANQSPDELRTYINQHILSQNEKMQVYYWGWKHSLKSPHASFSKANPLKDKFYQHIHTEELPRLFKASR
ncbi:MAG: hypothetical protein K2X66_17770 [Cyanobacteria bacterium]|nr:hypothetical protein [Cyanobacteriota bacterium]